MSEQPSHAERFNAHAAAHDAAQEQRRESLFLRFCDWTSEVIGWTLLFASGVVKPNASFLPSWFTGTAYNFPLNLLTTVAELFIGFLVAAAANRSQRVLSTIIDGIRTMLDKVETGVEGQQQLIQQNLALTQEVHKLAAELHAHLMASPGPGA